MSKFFYVFFFTNLLLLLSCNEQLVVKPTLFELRDHPESIAFENNLTYTEDFNPYTYRNFYNGGGVAIGDINNDGWLDVYFTGNMVDNKLFLNKGNWEFEDITQSAGVTCPNIWSSGANFVDLNGDGLLDLYVCKAGKPGGPNRHNELFINQGDLTFKETSKEYGLDITGLSIQSAFFDYDRDGDLDCYLLNNSIRSVGGFDLIQNQRLKPSSDGNKFLENRDGKFYDVSTQAGIYTSNIGYGLGITLSDFNLDGWTDVYISNDFFEKDYLYINNKNKTFTEKGEELFQSFPMGSMGADVGDLDNDGQPDLMITEMLPDSLSRKKTKATYESWKKYSLAVSKGYAHQMPRNMLQRNMGEAGFLEVGRRAGVAATNWSWSCLLQDFDNDGYKDIVVANGIYKDLLDRDYLTFVANDTRVKNLINQGEDAITQLINAMPSQAIPNYAFQNNGDFTFTNQTASWGLDQPSFSNGSAYGDLDNDGDLDLVINNVNMPSFIYENKTNKNERNYITVKLKGTGTNTQSIGAKITAYACGKTLMTEQFPSRGFQSSISNYLWIGLGDCTKIDSIKINWPDGRVTIEQSPPINKTITYSIEEVPFLKNITDWIIPKSPIQSVDTLDFTHREIKFNQFNRERLLYKMNSTSGPAIAVTDLNKDGRDDIFVGGGKNQSSAVFISSSTGYQKSEIPFQDNIRSEVVEAIFFDSDQDGDQDLYLARGGTAYAPYAKELGDEIYINDGKGNLARLAQPLVFPESVATGAVAIADYDEDGDLDIFVGNRNSHQLYGNPGSGYLFDNQGNNKYKLMDHPEFKKLGMITAAHWMEVDGEEGPELLITGEWMELSVWKKKGDSFENITASTGLKNTRGIWNHVLVADFNNDGKNDIFAGNAGENTALNNRHKLYIYDFDGNGQIEQILCETVDGKDYPVLDKDEMTSQLPGLRKKYLYYKDYAGASMEDLFGESQLQKAIVLSVHTLENELYFNNNGQFEKQPLPDVIQYASVHAAAAQDVNKDGVIDLLLGGNHYLVKPQFGRDDASKGWLLKGQKKGDQQKFSTAVSLNLTGEIRNFEWVNSNKLLIGINNKQLVLYTFKTEASNVLN